MQLDTAKGAFATRDRANKADGAQHVAGHLDSVTDGDGVIGGRRPSTDGGIAASSTSGRGDGSGHVAGQYRLDGVRVRVIGDGCQRRGGKGGVGALTRERRRRQARRVRGSV